MNHVRVDEYFRCIREGRYPVMRGYHYTPADLRLHLLFQEMQGLAVDRVAYRQLVGRDVVEEHTVVWRALDEIGWVTVADDAVRVHEDGIFYLPLIQNMLAHDRLEEMRRQRPTSTAGPTAAAEAPADVHAHA